MVICFPITPFKLKSMTLRKRLSKADKKIKKGAISSYTNENKGRTILSFFFIPSFLPGISKVLNDFFKAAFMPVYFAELSMDPLSSGYLAQEQVWRGVKICKVVDRALQSIKSTFVGVSENADTKW